MEMYFNVLDLDDRMHGCTKIRLNVSYKEFVFDLSSRFHQRTTVGLKHSINPCILYLPLLEIRMAFPVEIRIFKRGGVHKGLLNIPKISVIESHVVEFVIIYKVWVLLIT